MSLSLLLCPKCNGPLIESVFNQPELTPCPNCAIPLQVEIFPALFRSAPTGRDGETALVETESTCFYHPQKKALLPCEECGRFLCALCDCELHGKHYCPACLEVGRTKRKIKSLETERTLYDSLALSLAIIPLLIFYLTFVTAPAALYIAVRYWNAPRSIVHRSKIRLVIAILLASLQIIGWGIAIYFIFAKTHG
jgi:hypothetical protein